MLSTIHFHLIFIYVVFLTFKYSTVFNSLLGTIYFNLIITFFIYLEVSRFNVQTVYLQCFKRLTIINILIRNKTDLLFFFFFLLCIVLLHFNVGHNGGTWKAKYFLRWYLV